MNKTLPILGNEKEQQQIEFYEKLLGELIFSRATKNFRMFYFTRPTGWVLKKVRLQHWLHTKTAFIWYNIYLNINLYWYINIL